MKFRRILAGAAGMVVLLVSACAPSSSSDAAFWGAFAQGVSRASSPAPAPAPGTISSAIVGTFEGFAYGRVYRLVNGQVWRQTEYYTWYRYAYRPTVLIYRDGARYRMLVDGIDRTVSVTRLR